MKDLAPRIVAVAARLLPNERGDWGRAMLAELSHIGDEPSRLRFALGCIRAALFAPRYDAHSQSLTIVATMLLGVASCIALTAYVIARYPMAAQEASTNVRFAVVLIACVWLALVPPQLLVPSRRALRIGTTAGITLALVVAPAAWTMETLLPRVLAEYSGPLFVMLAVGGTLITCSAKVAASERSMRAGVSAALWAGIVSALLNFSIDLLGTVSGLNFAGHRLEMDPSIPPPELTHYLSKHMGEHLAATIRGLTVLPVFAVVLGTMGAAFGKRRRVRREAPC